MHSTLPEGDSPDLGLAQPTDQEVLLNLQKSAVEWKAALPNAEAYVRRERHLASQDLCQKNGQTWWALVDTTLPADKRQVLSSCCTVRKRALVRQDGKTHEAYCHVVGDVFCPPEFRKRGYGGRMMRELSKRLQTWQSQDGTLQFSALYSDVGKRFYHQNGGWVAFPSAHVHLPPRATTGTAMSDIRLLAASHLHSLCALDEDLLRRKLERRCGTGDAAAVAMVPEQRVITWHHAREEFVANEVLGRVPDIKGAHTHTRDGRQVWCVWNRSYSNPDASRREGNTLHILRLVAEDGDSDHHSKDRDQAAADEQVRDAMAAVLAAAQHQAYEWNCNKVELWNPEPVALAAARMLDPSASVVDREEDSITALAWYGDRDRQIEWLENDKLGWS